MTPDDCVRLIMDEYDFTLPEIRSRRVQPRLAEARHVGYWLALKTTEASYSEIATAFGKKDRTTISNGVGHVQCRRNSDSTFRQQTDALMEKLLGGVE